jgi:methylamine dehydrogenase heavy chain
MKALAELMIALMPALALAQSAVPQAEQFDVAMLKPQYPHRLFALDPYGTSGAAILDGDTLTIEGSIPTGLRPVLVLDPGGRYFYVCESIWTRGNRGTRQDMISVYDSRTLNLLAEIALPTGRLLSGSLMHDCDVSASGKLAYVYNMQPASSVTVVNLEQRRVVSTVELPGCALAFPWGDNGFSSLCGDGSVATVPLSANGQPGRVTHTRRLFNPDEDPIFSESLVDRSTGRAFFLSYTGLIYPAQLGEHPSIEKPWSLQAAAGLRVAGTGVQELAWRPGGSRMIAWHKAKHRLYVLVHVGAYWTQGEPGSDVWVLDIPSHTVIKRIKLPQPAISIAVSQDSEPRLYLLTEIGNITLDAETGEQKAQRTAHGESVAWVPGF